MSPNCAETIEMELEQNWVDTNPVDKKLEHVQCLQISHCKRKIGMTLHTLVDK